VKLCASAALRVSSFQSYTKSMMTLLVAWAMGQTHRTAPSVVGEWSVWRITMGDWLVYPPKLLGKLVLSADGKFTSHTTEGYVQDRKGSYLVQGDWITLKGTSVWTEFGHKDSSQPVQDKLLRRNGLLWDGAYNFGVGSYVYTRPGKGTSIPRDEKGWPPFEDFMK
jgi:hypothetical protein